MFPSNERLIICRGIFSRVLKKHSLSLSEGPAPLFHIPVNELTHPLRNVNTSFQILNRLTRSLSEISNRHEDVRV